MATYREALSEKLAPLLTPLAGASVAGIDVSYDPDFERIKAEIDKLSSVEQHEPAWASIQEVGASLLTSKGKDFRVVSWMAVAKVRTGGWGGLAESLHLYNSLARDFWDTMYPEVRRARARVNAFAWMTEQVVQHLLSRDVTLGDADAVRASDELLKELDQLLAEKLGDAYPGPGQLRSLMRDKLRAIPEAPAAPSQAQSEVATPAPAAPSAAAAPAPVAAAPAVATVATSVDDVAYAVRENAGALVAAAELLRSSDPARAWAYRLQRWGAWIGIEEAPPVEDGRTRLPVPPGDTRERLASLRDGQKWLELLLRAEEECGTYRFWLDAHRFVALAMDRLGPTFLAAREVVGREITAFVARLPGVAALTFSDGTPFAEPGTRSWLDEEAAKYGGSTGGSAAAAAVNAEDEEIARRFAEAQRMATEGNLGDGLALALALADRAGEGRTRFRARLAVGKIALDGSKPELARPLLEHLLTDVERYGLESWEPALCASLYSTLLVATREVLRAKGATPELAAKEVYLFDRLCRLDPAAAIRLSG